MAEHGAVSSVLANLRESDSVPVAAHEFARRGVPVFPCEPYGKRPMTARGFHDASTDLDQVETWWRRAPLASIGIPTGQASGMVTVDVDRHGRVDGYQAIRRAQQAGLVSGWEMLVRTPTGGMHAYYPAAPGVEQRSWQAGRAGVDFRGDGGYVIVPPSLRSISGSTVSYRVESVNPGPSSTIDSEALRNFLDPRSAPRPVAHPGLRREADAERLAAWVANRQEGERNAGLFWAACRLAENGVAPSDALHVLADAAVHAGLGDREVTRTVRSAYRTVSGPAHGHASADGPPEQSGRRTVQPATPVGRGL
ncbi:bifunctional DNA primase/polymerase [Kocuria sp. 2SI]|uniref:bifunctional DNA primase/polymerase n=1 Tax=Kocuria sp. 2SI TaxID=2502203 RepID=UPI001484D75C|nr:bifunctional DNA primase/polymerase [Kocuria sp. 2SI]